MAWVRVDDQFPSHPKVLGLSMAACGLWVTALCICNAHRTDGTIKGSAVPGMAKLPVARAMKLADELVEAELWVREGDDYRFHDYHDYQPKSSDLEARSDRISSARRIAGSKGGKRSGEVRRGKQNGSKDEAPIPSPVPIPNSTTTTSQARAYDKSGDDGPIPPTHPSPSLSPQLPPTRPNTIEPSADTPPPQPDLEMDLPAELMGEVEPAEGPVSIRGGGIPAQPNNHTPLPAKAPAWRTKEPSAEDTSPRAVLIRTMLGLEPYREVEQLYGAGFHSPLLEIFADHCVGTAGTIGCPLYRMSAVAEQVAVELGGQALLQGAPLKPDVWMTTLGKYLRGAKSWVDKVPTIGATPGEKGGAKGGGGGTQFHKRQGPRVQRDTTGACTAEGAQRHYEANAAELARIGREKGY